MMVLPHVNRNEIRVQTHYPFTIGPIAGKEAEKTMERGCEIMKKLDWYFWITSGNLLGIVRDGKMIDHDTDIDVCCRVDYFDDGIYDKTVELIKEMTRCGIIPCMTQVYKNRPMQTAFVDSLNHDVIFDIYYYYTGFGDLVNWNMEGTLRKPNKFVDELDSVEFKGVIYPTPKPVEEFLAWRYGEDWKTPRQKKDNWVEDAKHIKTW